jgi:hypothetical protein
MRNLFTTMQTMMTRAGFLPDVAMMILLATVVVMDMCMLMGPASGWSDTIEYRLFSQLQLPLAKNIIAYVLSKCEKRRTTAIEKRKEREAEADAVAAVAAIEKRKEIHASAEVAAAVAMAVAIEKRRTTAIEKRKEREAEADAVRRWRCRWQIHPEFAATWDASRRNTLEDSAKFMPRSAVTMDAKMVSVLEESAKGIRWFPIETLIDAGACFFRICGAFDESKGYLIVID